MRQNLSFDRMPSRDDFCGERNMCVMGLPILKAKKLNMGIYDCMNMSKAASKRASSANLVEAFAFGLLAIA
jgi:hypothetical protein